MIRACTDHDVRFSITVRQTARVRDTIDAISASAWVDIDYTDQGAAQVAATTLGDHQLIVRRTRLTGAQEALFPDWRHHAFVTDRAATPVELDADHRHHAVVELAIRDLKEGSGLNHCPGRINANAAWAVLTTIAHNLLRWTAALGLRTPGLTVAKTIRRRYLTVPGRITRAARRDTLHLPRHWPWQRQFLIALQRLRALPAPT